MENLELNHDKPYYLQIANYILDKIKSNIYKSGDIIPPERNLAEIFGVSRVTVRKAIHRLVNTGYLYRVQGKGTFVLDKVDEDFNKTNNSIGVILEYSNKELESRMLTGIEKVLDNNNYSMTYKSSNNNHKNEAETIQRMRNEGVVGLIIFPAEDQQESTAIFDLKNNGVPFVLIDRRLDNFKTDCVMSDNIQGVYKATEYLIQLGHEKIAFVKKDYTKTSSIKDRITGYRYALNEFGIEYNEKLIFSYNEYIEREKLNTSLYNFIKENNITAVVTLNDYIGIDVLKMCRRYKIQVPEQLSIIGFDNLDVIKHLEVPLTSIAQFPEKIGEYAAKILIRKIKSSKIGQEDIIKEIYFPTKLIIRDSCSMKK